MALSYFNLKKTKKGKEKLPESSAVPTIDTDKAPRSPILDEEDEKFLERLASITDAPDATPPPLPERHTVILNNGKELKGKDAQEALMDGAEKVPLPMSPPEITESAKPAETQEDSGDKNKDKRKSFVDYFALAQAKFTMSKDKTKDKTKEKYEKHEKEKDEKQEKKKDKGKEKAADSLHDAAAAQKSPQETEAEKEQEDLTAILDQLNLSAVNNRVFSFSNESQELLDKFKLVLKDIVNGVPTAYNDLEKLLTDSESQLKKMYGNLPPFLQNLVKSLPAKMTAGLAPELLAATAEKPGFDMKQRQTASGSGTKSKSKRSKIPSLKQLISAEGAVATMLRSILNFLKLRFPMMITGTNVLMSLAVFLLLFVFWYCHKRGRETRLEKERMESSTAGSAFNSGGSSYASSLADEKDDKDNSKSAGDADAEPPLIIHDSHESPEQARAATLADLPDVSQLPDPSSGLEAKTDGKTPLNRPPM